MESSLDQVNKIYVRLEKFFDPSIDSILNLSDQDRIEFSTTQTELIEEYKWALNMLRNTVPLLSEQDILTGYQEGCKLLQRNLSGYMCQNFNRLFLQTMIEAIEREEEHVAPHFLQAIADNLGREAIPIILSALDSRQISIKRTALSTSDQLKISEALPKIKKLTNDNNKGIAYLADEVMKRIEGG